MDLIADILLVSGALASGFYCLVLAKRLNKFNDLEKGVGGAVALLAAQVDDLNKSLLSAQSASVGSNNALTELTTRAETVSQRLELLIASTHDVSELPLALSDPCETFQAVSQPLFARRAQRTK